MSAPARYQCKPNEVEAVQIDSRDYDGMCEIIRWIGPTAGPINHDDNVIAIETVDGTMEVGDRFWIIKRSDGECYPLPPDVFAEIYEAGDQCGAPSGYHVVGDPMLCTEPHGHSGTHRHHGDLVWGGSEA